MTSQIIGVTLQGVDPPARFTGMVREIERMGYDHLWITDSSLHARDAFVYLTLAAGQSERLRLGTNCTHPHTRHPAVTANALASVNEVSGGRAILGVGAGDSPVEELGKPLARLSEVRSMLDFARRLYSGERFDYEGAHFTVHSGQLHHGLAGVERPKIYMTASGPKMLELAGAVADGVIVHCGVFPGGLEFATGHVRRGAESAGRDFAEIDFAWQVFGVLDEDLDRARNAARPMAAWFPLRSPLYCDLAGVPADLAKQIREVYTGGEFHEAVRAHALTTDEMVDAFTITGGVGLWKDRLEMANDYGVHHIELFGLGDRMELYADLASKVFSR
jgi:5,10-methylenetetrahydromethanopterin reductase